MNKFLSGCAALALAAFSCAAQATDFDLSNVVFDDGTTLTGSFSIDDSTGNVTAFDIFSQTGALPGVEYTTGDSVFHNLFTDNSYIFAKYDGSVYTQYVNLIFGSPLASGSNALTSDSYECDNCFVNRFVVSGSAISGAVPEPASWALMLGGFGLVGGAMRSRRKAAVSFG